MLIEFPKGAIKINGDDRIKDFRINAVKNQFRMKFSVLKEAEEIPFDIVAYDVSKKIDGLGIGFHVAGVEQEHSKPFDLNLSYKITGKPWRLNGNFNGKEVTGVCDTFVEIVEVIAGTV